MTTPAPGRWEALEIERLVYSAVTLALTAHGARPTVAVVSAGPAAQAVAKTRRHPIVKSLRYNYDLYLLLLPALAYLIIFKYAPMYGLQISFRDFNPVQGMWGSPWAGLKHFFRFFDSYMFVTVVRNTLALNLYQLLVGRAPPTTRTSRRRRSIPNRGPTSPTS